MNVLIITGDKRFAQSERFALQASAVEKLIAIYWGLGSLWPRLPKEKFDVVTVQDPFWRGLFALYAAGRFGARFNVQVHADLSTYSFARRILASYVLKKADSIRTVSERIKKQIEVMGVKASIRVLPVYIDISRFTNLIHKPHETKTVLWIGRFEQEKDPLYALTVFKQVCGTGVVAKLVMLGAGSMESEMREKAKGLSVEWAGWQDPATYLGAADVVLCTSRSESWGASMVEALAAGVPVVAPDVGIAKEAGAILSARTELGAKVLEILKASPVHAELKLTLLTREAWAEAWKLSL